jgi:hypothetical protein
VTRYCVSVQELTSTVMLITNTRSLDDTAVIKNTTVNRARSKVLNGWRNAHPTPPGDGSLPRSRPILATALSGGKASDWFPRKRTEVRTG